MDPLKSISMMKLHISSESYTFLHLYAKANLVFLRTIYDDSNYKYDFAAGPAVYINTWY